MRPLRVLLVAAFFVTLAAFPTRPAAAAETIRIGFMGPLTGIFAQAGKDMLDGLKMALEQVNYQAGGRKIELIEEDTEGNSATALAKYRKLVDHDKIHVMTGILLVNVGNSLVPLIERDRLPTLFLTTPDDLTKRKVAKWILRSNFSASQIMHPLGDYAARTLKYRRVATIAMDNGFGHEEVGGFQRVFEDAGGKVVQKIWVPLNALDFAPYLSQVARDVDAVCAVFVAGQAVRFVKQYGESALKGKTPLIGTGVMIDESALRGMGDEAVGVVGSLLWSPTLQNPGEPDLHEDGRGQARTDARLLPRDHVQLGPLDHRGRQCPQRAGGGSREARGRHPAGHRDHAGSARAHQARRLGQSHRERLHPPRGQGRRQARHHRVHTYPAVSQFWTYKPEEFLKTPPYSRDYPPAKP